VNFFESDYPKYIFVELDNEVIISSGKLVTKYGLIGLRTLDSIQMASILKVKTNIDFVVCADDLLKQLIELEGIKVC